MISEKNSEIEVKTFFFREKNNDFGDEIKVKFFYFNCHFPLIISGCATVCRQLDLKQYLTLAWGSLTGKGRERFIRGREQLDAN